jgi:hypothetical protein
MLAGFGMELGCTFGGVTFVLLSFLKEKMSFFDGFESSLVVPELPSKAFLETVTPGVLN